jgi:hypothetical protein
MLPFLVFAEGGTTNGTGIMKFKKGAFHSEKTVQPIFLRYSFGTLNPAFDTIPFTALVVFTLSTPGGMHCEVNKLPNFKPNEYLFDKNTEQGTQRWEIFAWAIRDIMLDASGMEACDYPLSEKNEYEKLM